ncbi:hypothetical protein [Actinocorallia longicatena]|uniref:Polysaccharide deacetylase n=1 Tax=Actinocorallia longicatena TaxID=111803 RepID=A0ABP6QEF7_9ACTN
MHGRKTLALIALLTTTAACAGESAGSSPAPARKAGPPQAAKIRLIGDGSTSDTGPQPRPTGFKATRLAPGEKPPQFVVFSWDGAGATDGQMARFRALSKRYGASMTFFLSGLYTVPMEERHVYKGPGHARGASDIPFFSAEGVHETIRNIGLAWREGHEIGTHFNGHFCGPSGVRSWTPADWADEIRQAKRFVSTWKTTTGFKDLPPLPFDYDKELIGSRAPCLEGRPGLLPAARRLGWRYDSSGTGLQIWPKKRKGLWDVPLQSIPMPGHAFEVLSMDYNFLANQSGARLNGPSYKHGSWRRQTDRALSLGFQRAYNGNRAPMIIGNHFEQWNGGIYMDAVAGFMEKIADIPGVQMVSFRQLCDWLDKQDPKILARLRTLGVAQPPQTGWTRFLG